MSDASLNKTAPKPLDALVEEARLATLERYRVLSPDHIAGLSRLSQEAALSLRATQAAVSFVDSTLVWFGGAFGFHGSNAPRENSFCDAVVRSGLPLLVPDGLVDPRFWNHELVRREPGLRSYAGVPLIDSGGYTLGTLAVYSVTPNAFSTSILRELSALATLVRDFLCDVREPSPPPIEPLPVPVRKVQGWLGVKTAEFKAGSDQTTGLVVVSVAKRSPAEAAGLRPTDILHSIGGQVLAAVPDVAAAMAGRAAGSRVPVHYRRSGQWHACDIEIRQLKRLVRVR